MFGHIMINRIGKRDAMVVVSGDAVFTHAQEMQTALGEALETCDNLTIDVRKVQASDVTFRVLLCSLHRRSELENKTIAILGTLPGREDARVNGCLKNSSQRCALCNSAVKGGAAAVRRTEVTEPSFDGSGYLQPFLP